MLQRKPSNVSDKSRNKPKVKIILLFPRRKNKQTLFVHLLWWNVILRKYFECSANSYSVLDFFCLQTSYMKPSVLVTNYVQSLLWQLNYGVKPKMQSRRFTAEDHINLFYLFILFQRSTSFGIFDRQQPTQVKAEEKVESSVSLVSFVIKAHIKSWILKSPILNSMCVSVACGSSWGGSQ